MVSDFLNAISGFLKDNPIIVPIIVVIILDFIFTRKIYKFCIDRSFGLLLFVFGICFIVFAWFFFGYLFIPASVLYQIIYDQVEDISLRSRSFRNAALSIGGTITLSIAVLGVVLTVMRNLLARQQNNTDEQKLVTEQISRAINQIGAYKQTSDGQKYEPNVEVRLGGLYSLQRIMRDSPKDEESIARIFYAYVRENTKRDRVEQPKPNSLDMDKIDQLPEDIEAAINIISQFNKSRLFDGKLNLSHTDFTKYSLKGLDFSNIILESADFRGSDLSDSDFINSDLSNAKLGDVKLYRANLSGANLSNVNFMKLSTTGLFNADLSNANLSRTDLSGVKLDKVRLYNVNLSRAILSGTDLSGAILYDANFDGINLNGVDLSGLDLTNVLNLTQKQINQASGDKHTVLPKLPKKLIPPAFWKESKKEEDDDEEYYEEPSYEEKEDDK